MTLPKSRKGLKRGFQQMPEDVKAFFSELPDLLESNFSLDVSLAYVFFRLEKGQRQTLFCGARKLHKTESTLTWKAIDKHELTRNGFKELFETIYGFEVNKTASDEIKAAESIRDDLMHGRDVTEAKKREAISKALEYAMTMNALIYDTKSLGFKPFTGDLRGFTGRLESLDKSTTRWILKGMKLELS